MSDMNINATSAYTASSNVTATKTTEPVAQKEEVKATDNTGVVYEKSSGQSTKAPYTINKMSAEDRAALVKQLNAELESNKSKLSDLVSQMLTGQANTKKLSDLFTPDMLKKVTAADIAQAKEDISEDGYWGVKNTSQRLFDFASALAGDDVNKMKEMQDAMKKGFEKAKAAWGGELPDISKQTIDAADKLFDDYYASKQTE